MIKLASAGAGVEARAELSNISKERPLTESYYAWQIVLTSTTISTQPNLTSTSCVGHENDFAHHPTIKLIVLLLLLIYP